MGHVEFATLPRNSNCRYLPSLCLYLDHMLQKRLGVPSARARTKSAIGTRDAPVAILERVDGHGRPWSVFSNNDGCVIARSNEADARHRHG